MSVNIRSFAAMNHSVVDTLWSLGFRTNEDVLARAASPRQRQALSRESKLDEHLLYELARRADLARVKGIGNLYAVLLKHAGVFGIQDLAEKDAYRQKKDKNDLCLSFEA